MPNRLAAIPVLFVLAAAQAACVPTVGRLWDVQPVEGMVVDGVTGKPVARARVVSERDPTLQAITDESGTFFVGPQSRITLSLRMFGSYIDHHVWQVSHDDYAPAMVVTSTIAPAHMPQPSNPTVPLFRELAHAPTSCPFGPYFVRLYQWKSTRPLLARYDPSPEPHTIPCRDAYYRSKIEEAFVRLLEAAEQGRASELLVH